MTVELLVNVTPQETRVALVENGMLQEVFIERARRRGLVGNIYRGAVSRVLPGMQAAFVDIGLERAAFLHASDIARRLITTTRPTVCQRRQYYPLLHEGQKILVQVIKDPLGTKGARLTTHITIPSRYLVFMPETENVGVSQRIEDEAERQRLREIVLAERDEENRVALYYGLRQKVSMKNLLPLICISCNALWSSVQEHMSNRRER